MDLLWTISDEDPGLRISVRFRHFEIRFFEGHDSVDRRFNRSERSISMKEVEETNK